MTRVLNAMSKIISLPFKGRVGVGMGVFRPTPILTFPLKGKEFYLTLRSLSLLR